MEPGSEACPETMEARGPALGVAWTPAAGGFLPALTAWLAPAPVPPAVSSPPLRPVELRPMGRGRASLLSFLLHVLVAVSPLPALLLQPPPRIAATGPRIELDLNWTGSPYLPPIAPEPAPPRQREAKKPPPKRGAEELARQEIVVEPPVPDNSRQTLVTQFKLDELRPRAVALPNIVVPPAPTPPPAPKTPIALPTSALLAQPLLPARPASDAELALRDAALENLYPRLTLEARAAIGQAPEVNAPPGAPGDAAALEGGLLALSPQPARPAPSLELPNAPLSGRFSLGPVLQPGSPAGLESGDGEATIGDGQTTATLTAPGVFVAPAGPAPPPGPVVVGPDTGSPPEQPAARGLSDLPLVERPGRSEEEKPAAPQGAASPEQRAEEMLEPGAPSLGRLPRVYTVYINMPNLTSRSGSWALRFSELASEQEPAAGGAAELEEMEAPLAVRKVDPKYSAQARRERLEGDVLLYAVVQRDGTVTSVSVVRSLTDELDRNAAEAFRRWRFEPARKNGRPIDVEVVIEIPFRLSELF